MCDKNDPKWPSLSFKILALNYNLYKMSDSHDCHLKKKEPNVVFNKMAKFVKMSLQYHEYGIFLFIAVNCS